MAVNQDPPEKPGGKHAVSVSDIDEAVRRSRVTTGVVPNENGELKTYELKELGAATSFLIDGLELARMNLELVDKHESGPLPAGSSEEGRREKCRLGRRVAYVNLLFAINRAYVMMGAVEREKAYSMPLVELGFALADLNRGVTADFLRAPEGLKASGAHSAAQWTGRMLLCVAVAALTRGDRISLTGIDAPPMPIGKAIDVIARRYYAGEARNEKVKDLSTRIKKWREQLSSKKRTSLPEFVKKQYDDAIYTLREAPNWPARVIADGAIKDARACPPFLTGQRGRNTGVKHGPT